MKNTSNKLDKIYLEKREKNDKENLKYEKIRIPLDKINPTDLYVPVQINGEKMICKRGEDIYLPKCFVKLLRESGYLD